MAFNQKKSRNYSISEPSLIVRDAKGRDLGTNAYTNFLQEESQRNMSTRASFVGVRVAKAKRIKVDNFMLLTSYLSRAVGSTSSLMISCKSFLTFG